MSKRAHRNTELPSRARDRRLWFGVLAAPAAWSLHEIASVAIVGRSCAAATLAAWQWTALVALSVAAIVVAAAALVTAYRAFHASNGRESIATSAGRERVTFMAQFGFLLSAFLLLGIVFFGVTPLLVDPCLRVT